MPFAICEGMLHLNCCQLPDDNTTTALGFLKAGFAHHQAGQLEEAGTNYRAILQSQPELPEALHLLGLLCHQIGKNEEAVAWTQRAIDSNRTVPSFYNTCGEAYRALHKPESAIVWYGYALAIDPHFIEARYNMGIALQDLGRQEEAIDCYERVLSEVEDSAPAHNNLGVIFQEKGWQAKCIAQYEHALTINPYSAEAHSNLGIALKAIGKPIDAILHHQTSMRLKPEQLIYRLAFAECLSGLELTQASDSLRGDLIELLSFDGAYRQDLAFAASSLVVRSAEFQEALLLAEQDYGAFLDGIRENNISTYTDALFLGILKHVVIRHPIIERLLTSTRRALLHLLVAGGFPESLISKLRNFVYALARQCFLNDYVYAVSALERIELQQLSEELLRQAVGLGGNLREDVKIRLAVIASYSPLCDFEQEEMVLLLAEDTEDDEVTKLARQQYLEPRAEKEIKEKIESLGTSDNKISKQVRTQYEESPYPRWLDARKTEPQRLRAIIRRLLPCLPLERVPDIEAPEILVAGCGTGQQAINRALEFRSSQVLGVDISLTSLAYAKRRAGELNVRNVDFVHGDLLWIKRMDRMFDLVECTGVLHHLENPLEGWRGLAGVLRPGGLMSIGLYSQAARRDVVAAQSFVARGGYAPNSAGIRESRQAIIAQPQGSEVEAVTRIVDFYTMSEARDLLFHVQEHRFTIPMIAELIKQLGLAFMGFEFKNGLERERYFCSNPADQSALSLGNWHEFERCNVNTFIGLYLFWVQKL